MHVGVKNIYPIVVLALCIACNILEKKNKPDPLSEYSLASPSQALTIANGLRNSAEFTRADSAYHSIVKNDSTPEVREFALLNQFICKLAANDTLHFDTLFHSTHYPELSTLVNGILLTRKDRSGFDELHRAVAALKKKQLQQSFYYFLSQEQLGLAHRQSSSKHLDSVEYYYRFSLEQSRRFGEYTNNQIRILYRLALLSLVHRDEVNGLGFAESALTLAQDSTTIAKLMICKANLLRKLNRMEESDLVRNQVKPLVNKLQQPTLRFLFVQEQSLFHYYKRDSASLKADILLFSQMKDQIPAFKAHASRMNSYYFDLINQPKERLRQAEIALNGFLRERVPNPQLVFEAFSILIQGYTKAGDLEKAQHFVYQDLVYGTSLSNTSYSFDRLMAKEVMNEKYTFVSYDLLGKISIEKYKRNHDPRALQNALILYQVIDSLLVVQVRTEEDESLLEFSRMGHGIYSNGIEVCVLLHQIKPSEFLIDQAHRFMERSKSLLTYQDILKHNEDYFSDVPKTIKQRELQLKMNLSEVKSIELSKNTERLRTALEEMDRFYSALKRDYPDYYEARYRPDIPGFDYFSNKAKQERVTLLQYHIEGNALYIIKYGSEPTFVRLSIDNQFYSHIHSLQNILSHPSTTKEAILEFKKSAFALYKVLIKPVGKLSETITIVPHAELNTIPFEVLLSDTTGNFKSMKYLINQHSVNYAFGLKLTNSNDTFDRPNSYVGYSYSQKDEKIQQLPYLPGAVRELEAMRSIFGKGGISRMGIEANRETFFLDVQRDVDVLHLGMHALSDPANRYSNAIFFQAKGGLTDTVFGYELVPKFIKAETVVLTACQSAYGATIAGEGTISLARSFQQTGVNNVISSLWSLPDYSSPTICRGLYEKMRAGFTPAQSLSASKRRYLENADEHTAAPFFWAGLLCFSRTLK